MQIPGNRERAAERMKEVGRKYGKITGKENLIKALKEGKDTTNGNYKHGMAGTRLYNIYHGMKQRCLNPKCHSYPDYGGRGIMICKEWLEDFQEFANWALTKGYADNLTIERKDVNGNYEPNNYTWTDTTTQANNTRRNHYIEYKGKVKTIAEWAKDTGMSQQTISSRLRNGWSIGKTLKTPEKKKNK